MKKFLHWFNEQSVSILSKEIKIEEINGNKRVIAKEDIPMDTIVARIPKSCILSVPNSRIASELTGYTGALALTIALCYEITHEPSAWQPYIDILPKRNEYLPLLWFSEQSHLPTPESSPVHKRIKPSSELITAQEILKQTSIYDQLISDQELLRSDYETIVKPLCQRYKWDDVISFELFRDVSTVVASRCFDCGSFHGDSLVPIADLFNHEVDENIHLETLSDSDDDDDDVDEFEKVDLKEDSEIIDMRMIKNVYKGEEIFNTYGDHSNAYLLLKYGFVCEKNPFNVLQLSSEFICDIFKAQGNCQELLESRIIWWINVGRNLLLGEQVEKEFDDEDEDEEEEEENEESFADESIDFEEFYQIDSTGAVPFDMTCFISTILISSDFIKEESEEELMDICHNNSQLETMHEEYRVFLCQILEKKLDSYSGSVVDPEEASDYRLKCALKLRNDEVEILKNSIKMYSLK